MPPTPSWKICERLSPFCASTSATRSMRGQPTTCTVSGSSPSLTSRSAASVHAGKCTCANFVTACRIDSSMFPDTSPPIVWASGMFMYVAASAVAIVSKRSPTVITTSGWSRSNDGRQLEQAEAGRLRHRRRRLALDEHEHALVRLEAVALDQLEDGAVAVEERRRADDELQLELGVRVDRRASPT